MAYQKLNDLEGEIVELWKDGKGEFKTIADLSRYIISQYGDFGRPDDSVRKSISIILNKSKEEPDKDLLLENVRLAKEKQKLQDVQRIERKAFREQARVENAVSDYCAEIARVIKENSKDLKSKLNIKDCGIVGGGTGVIHITDLHANELINLPHNQYNFEILSKRLKKQISESLAYFKYRGVDKVLIALTGDLINSDRRLDEMLNQATNRAKATVITSHILIQAILHVREHYEVDIISVLGNESRVKQEMSFSNEAFSDNYDFNIMSMCKQTIEFAGIEGVRFLSIDKMETTVDFGGQRWLLAHDVSKYTDKQEKTQSAIGRYALRGESIEFIIGGHIHAHRGTDISCRSGSLAGSNTYNEHALNLQGRASAVCHVVKGKERFYQYIDCQEADNEGYEIISQLKAYNIKSDSKLINHPTVFSIVI